MPPEIVAAADCAAFDLPGVFAADEARAGAVAAAAAVVDLALARFAATVEGNFALVATNKFC